MQGNLLLEWRPEQCALFAEMEAMMAADAGRLTDDQVKRSQGHAAEAEATSSDNLLVSQRPRQYVLIGRLVAGPSKLRPCPGRDGVQGLEASVMLTVGVG